MKQLPLLSLMLLLACPGQSADLQASPHGATRWSGHENLARQEKRVEELRERKGGDDPETLKALAALIRLRTAHGDVVSGELLFEELLDLDLRKAPILVYAKPPIEVAHHLGGLGELAAARDLLEAAVDKVKTIIPDGALVLEVDRALARLQVALEVPQAEARLREVETRWRTISSDEKSAADYLRNRPSIDSTTEGRDPWRPSDSQYWAERISSTAIDHRHLDNMISHAPGSGFETAERLRATPGTEVLSLITRIRRIGDSGKEPPPLPLGQMDLEDIPAPHDDLGFRPHAGPLPAASLELAKIRATARAVKRALDRIPIADPRSEALRTELARVQTLRADHLNAAWRSLEETYIPIDSSAIQKRIDRGTVLLYYIVAADHTDLLVLAAEAEPTHHRIPVSREQLERKVDDLRVETRHETVRGTKALDRSKSGDESAAAWLFDALLAPAEREIDAAARLLIVPDGPLHRVPFAALQRAAGEGQTQYLIEWKPIHFAPSAGSYLALLERRQQKRQRQDGLVAFGDPDYDGTSAAGVQRSLPYAVRSAASRGHSGRLEPLPGTRKEVEQIGRLFKDQKREARVLLQGQAGERAARDALDASFLHFAVHGFVDGEQPEHSFLALTLPEAVVEGGEDGILEGWEIEDEMRLDAELVTLSACETAVGKERGGEGPSSLSRAFFSAGARSVLAALWKVDDKATADLMVRFYHHHLHGSSKDEALRLAQLEVLAGTAVPFRAPYYWAAFQVSGDWR